MSLSLPIPAQVTLTWTNLTPDAGENILKVLRGNSLSGAFEWAEIQYQPQWEVKSFSCKKTINKEEEEVYKITATIH